MKRIFYLLSLLLFLVYCSKSPIIPENENTGPDLDALGILTDSLGNYIDSLGNVVIIDDNGNIISLGIAVDSLGNYIDSIGNIVILDSLGNIIIVDSVLFGCTQIIACNYDPLANVNDGSCIMPDGCTDPLALNYNPLALCDDGSCIQYQLFQSCIDATGEWAINPACPVYEVPALGILINVEDRFDHNIYIVCDSNRLYINFGSNQTAYAEIDDFGELTIPNQPITLDLQNEGYGFLDVNVHGDGNIISGGIGVLNLTFIFEIIPGAIDSTSCILSIDRDIITPVPTDCNGVANGVAAEDDCGDCHQSYIYDLVTHTVTFISDTVGLVLGSNQMLILAGSAQDIANNPNWNAGCK